MHNMDAIIKKLLDELEVIFTIHEEEVDLLELENKDYVSISNYIEILEKSKIDFINGFLELKGERRDEFDELINRVIPQAEIKEGIFQKIYLFNLLRNISNHNSSEYMIQKNSCFEALDLLKDKLKDCLDSIDYRDNIEKINNLTVYLESIIKIGSSFDISNLSEAIEDIDSFSRMLGEVNLTSEEKSKILEFVISENIRLYGQNISKENTKNNQLDNDNLERLDGLLENDNDKYLSSEEVVEDSVERHILFLMRNEDLSYFEEDLYEGRENRKLDNTIYHEAIDLLNSVKDNDNIDYHQIRDVWKSLYQFGTRYVSNYNLGLFYIPIDDDNLLIVGMKEATGDFGFYEMNTRVGLCEEQIVEIIKKVKNGQITVGEIEKINEEEKKILALLAFLEIISDEVSTEEKGIGRTI